MTMPATPRLVHLHQHHLAHEGVGQVAAGVDDDDVAGLGERDRLVEHQIVARRSFHGQRRAGHAAAAVPGAKPGAACGQSRHAVADIGDRQSRETLDDIGVDLPLAQ